MLVNYLLCNYVIPCNSVYILQCGFIKLIIIIIIKWYERTVEKRTR